MPETPPRNLLENREIPGNSGKNDLETAWQNSLSGAIRSLEELLDRLNLTCSDLNLSKQAIEEFPLLVTESFLNRMEPGNPDDPLLRQVLPDTAEESSPPGFLKDVLQEKSSHSAPGLLKKYRGRALMITTGTCAIHCRYCFRRHYSYPEEPRRWEDWQPALEAIESDSSLREILFSGGDPLILGDSRLEKMIHRLEEIPHIKRLRIHTRLPVVLPNRVTDTLLNLLKRTRLTVLVVIHANHHQELTDDAADAIRCLTQAGLTVLNQAVLLKGVNDTKESQFQLCESLVNLGVIPYYLHQLDRVEGTSHFEVETTSGKEIIQYLRENLPGYAIPQYVREIPGESGKSPIF